MPHFEVKATFELSDRKRFVLAGSTIDGTIEPGMFVEVPFNAIADLRLLICEVEYARTADGEEVCLCVQAGPNMRETYRNFNLSGKTLPVNPPQ